MSWTATVGGVTHELSQVSLDRSANTSIPSRAADWAGATIGGGSVTIPYRVDGIKGQGIVVSRDDSSVLTGTVLSASYTAAAGLTKVEVADPTGTLVGVPVDVPVVPAINEAQAPGAHSQAVVSHILGSVGLGPHGHLAVDPSTILHAPLAGSMMPTVPHGHPIPYSGSQTSGYQVLPEFAQQEWGLALSDGFASFDCTPVIAASGDVVRVLMAVDLADADLELVTEFAFGDRSIAQAWDTDWITDGSDSGSLNLPGEGVGYGAIDYKVQSDGTLLADIWWNGVLERSDADVTEDQYAVALPSVIGEVVGGVYLSGFGSGGGFTIQHNPADDPPAAPVGTLRGFGLPMTVMLADGDGWATIQLAAEASGSIIWCDADGHINAYGSADLDTAVAASTLDADTVVDLGWIEDAVALPSRVEATFAPMTPTTVATLATELVYVLGRTTSRLRIAWDGYAIVTPYRKVGLTLWQDEDMTIPIRHDLWWLATQDGPSAALVSVRNPGGQAGYVEVALTPPAWGEVLWTRGDNVSASAPVEGGTAAPLSIEASPIAQDYAAAETVAAWAAARLRVSDQEVEDVPVTPALEHLDVGDVVELDEPVNSGLYIRRALVVSRSWSDNVGNNLALRTIFDTLGHIDFVWDGQTLADIDAAYSTLAGFDSAPISGA